MADEGIDEDGDHVEDDEVRLLPTPAPLPLPPRGHVTRLPAATPAAAAAASAVAEESSPGSKRSAATSQALSTAALLTDLEQLEQERLALQAEHEQFVAAAAELARRTRRRLAADADVDLGRMQQQSDDIHARRWHNMLARLERQAECAAAAGPELTLDEHVADMEREQGEEEEEEEEEESPKVKYRPSAVMQRHVPADVTSKRLAVLQSRFETYAQQQQPIGVEHVSFRRLCKILQISETGDAVRACFDQAKPALTEHGWLSTADPAAATAGGGGGYQIHFDGVRAMLLASLAERARPRNM